MIHKFKIPTKALRGLIDRFTYGEDWHTLKQQNPDKYCLWQKVDIETVLNEEEHKLFINDITSGVSHMEDIVDENSEYKDMKKRVSEYKAAVKWIKMYLQNHK